MNTRLIRTILLLLVLFSSLVSCKRINEATTLGGDIIPGVDGVTTFDTTITVEAYNELFTATNDSLGISRGDDHFLGNISGDPLFGKTNARIFLELKPIIGSARFSFSGIYNPDSLFLDSVVMVLGWKGTYGDTITPQRFRVYEIDPSNEFKIDSAYQVRNEYFTYSSQLGFRDVFPYTLNDSVKVFRDTTISQLRIRLSDEFGKRLLGYDTTNAYYSDSAFKANLKGFAITSDEGMGNSLIAFGLQNNLNTKLAIYYRYQKNGKLDTTVDYFYFHDFCAQHNYIKRNFTGTPIQGAQGGTSPDDLIYLINAPGSYANFEIPALKTLSNRIVHRAELIMEEVFDPSDQTFIPPEALYIDVYDSSLAYNKAVPYDFVPDNSTVSLIQFGMYGKNTVDASGKPIRVWKFNLTRYVQNILNQNLAPGRLRLLTHRFVFNYIKLNYSTNTGDWVLSPVAINSHLAIGRVRLGGGNHATQPMRLRIVYSKI